MPGQSRLAGVWPTDQTNVGEELEFEIEVEFLSGDEHLRTVAGYYLELARKAYEGEEQPDEFGRPKVVKDFRRALDFYQKARNIHLDEEQAPKISYRIGMSKFEQNDRFGAVAEWTRLLEQWPEGKLAADATYYWTIIGPVSITALFFTISVPMITKRMMQTKTGYDKEVKARSGIIPWPASQRS